MALETESSAASADSTPQSTASVSSGTASAAMLKAAGAASSPAPAEVVASHGPTTTATPQTQGDLQAAALAAAKQPASEGQPGVAAPADAPALKQRFDSVHAKGVTAGESRVFQSVGLDAANPQHREALSQGVALFRALTTDSMGFFHELASRLGITLPAAKAETAWEWPKPALQSEDGKGAYTDAQVKEIVENMEARVMKMVRGELQPVSQFVGSEQQSRERTAAIAAATQTKDAILTRARAMPHFKENEAAIAGLMREMDPATKKQLGPAGALYEAYNQFIRTNTPTLESQAEARVRESHNKKARSAGQVDPSGAGGDSVKTEIVGPAALAKRMEQMAKRFAS